MARLFGKKKRRHTAPEIQGDGIVPYLQKRDRIDHPGTGLVRCVCVQKRELFIPKQLTFTSHFWSCEPVQGMQRHRICMEAAS